MRLRRQPPRPARFEQDALGALRQRRLGGRRPGLAAEVLQVGRDEDADPRHLDDAGHAEDVRAIVRAAARPRSSGCWDRCRTGSPGPRVLSCAPSAVVPLDACSPATRENV